MRVLKVGLTEQKFINAAIEKAREKPLSREQIIERASRVNQRTVRLDSTHTKDDMSHVELIYVPNGFYCAISFEDQPNIGLCKHLSISVDSDKPNTLPGPEAIAKLAMEFGFSQDKETRKWVEESAPGKLAMNLVQRA